jgi:hypothetical protein
MTSAITPKALSHPLDTRPYFVLNGEALVEDTSFLESKVYLDRSRWPARLFFATQPHSRLMQLAYRASRALRRSPPPNANEEVSPFNQPGLPHNVYREPVNADWQERVESDRAPARGDARRVCAPRGSVRCGHAQQSTTGESRFSQKASVRGTPGCRRPLLSDRRIKAIGERADFRC